MKQSPDNTPRTEQKNDAFPVQCDVGPAAAPELEQLRHAAAQGDPDAQFQLAELFYRNYEEGDGGEKALDEAVNGIRKPPETAAPERSSRSDGAIRKAGASKRIPKRQAAGTVSPPNRGIPRRNTGSVGAVSTARASKRTGKRP